MTKESYMRVLTITSLTIALAACGSGGGAGRPDGLNKTVAVYGRVSGD
jgi:hypothetical protein